MSAHKNSCWIAAVPRDVPMHPADGFGDVLNQFVHSHFRQQSMVRRDKYESSFAQHLGLQCDIALVPCLPSTSVDPKHDGQILPGPVLRSVDIKDVALVPVLYVGNVRCQSL